jgi:hypothetical protein
MAKTRWSTIQNWTQIVFRNDNWNTGQSGIQMVTVLLNIQKKPDHSL